MKNECSEGLKIELFPFCKVLGKKVETVFEKEKKNLENCLNQKFIIGSILKNGSEVTLKSKMIAASVWKEHFLLVSNF